MKKKPVRTKTVAVVPNLENYIGRTVVLPTGEKIKINTIVGNIGLTLGRRPEDQRPQFAEINGKYRISFLRFFAQMEGEDYTEEEFRAFEEMQVYSEKESNQDVTKLVDNIIDKARKDVENGQTSSG